MSRKTIPVSAPTPLPVGYVVVLQGRLLLNRDGTVRAYGGQVVPADDPAVQAHQHPGLDFVRCEAPVEPSVEGATHGAAEADEPGGASSVSARRSLDEGEHFAE